MTILSDGGRYEMKNSAHTPISKPHVPDAYQAYIAKRRECEETNPLLVTKSKWKDRHPHLWPLLIVLGSPFMALLGVLDGVGFLMALGTFLTGWVLFVKSFPRGRVRTGIAIGLVTILGLIIFAVALIVMTVGASHCGPGMHSTNVLTTGGYCEPN